MHTQVHFNRHVLSRLADVIFTKVCALVNSVLFSLIFNVSAFHCSFFSPPFMFLFVFVCALSSGFEWAIFTYSVRGTSFKFPSEKVYLHFSFHT